MARKTSPFAAIRQNVPLAALIALLAGTFFLGGASRGDVLSLVILRPLAIVSLGIGLIGLSSEHIAAHRAAFVLMAASILLVLGHLIPLPPFLWTHLPGRGLIAKGDELVGLEGIWRPISLVPYRGWNTLWAMTVPAAVLVLSAQVKAGQQWTVLRVVIGLGLASALLGFLQAITGFNASLFFYKVTNSDSPVGLFANRNHQAALMCVTLPLLALVGARAAGNSRALVRVICASLGIGVVMVILATGSRGGLLFMLMSCAAAAAIALRAPGTRRARTRQPKWIAPAAVGGGALLAAIGVAVAFSRAGALARLTGGDAVEDNRLEVWRITARAVAEYFPIGSGVGSFVEVFAMREPPHMLSLAYWNHAHNDWLEWLLEGGLPAAILLALAAATWVRKAARITRAMKSPDAEVLLSFAGAVVVLTLGLWSLVDYPLRVPSLAALATLAAVWMTAGSVKPQRANLVEGTRRLAPHPTPQSGSDF